ncbi:MAG: hypothetical protein ACM3H7_07985 [Acidobacteriaceae bacterium]
MKKQPVFTSVFLILALLSLAIPSPVSAHNEPVGDRISLYYPQVDFPAGTPFHIFHGWVQTSDDEAIGIFDFTLEVDGDLRSEDFKQFSAESGEPDLLRRLWVYNFPEGMTGMHTFTGHWYAPCQYAVDWLGYPGPCATANEKVETNSRTTIVNFYLVP